MRQNYTNTVIYHPNEKAKAKFNKEVLKRFPTFSAMARMIEKHPEKVFNPELNEL